MSDRSALAHVKTTISGSAIDTKGSSPASTSAGKPIVSTGDPKTQTAVVHGQVPGSTVIIDNPA